LKDFPLHTARLTQLFFSAPKLQPALGPHSYWECYSSGLTSRTPGFNCPPPTD